MYLGEAPDIVWTNVSAITVPRRLPRAVNIRQQLLRTAPTHIIISSGCCRTVIVLIFPFFHFSILPCLHFSGTGLSHRSSLSVLLLQSALHSSLHSFTFSRLHHGLGQSPKE